MAKPQRSSPRVAAPVDTVIAQPSDTIAAAEEIPEGLQADATENAQKEITVVTTCRLLEPYLFIRFAPGVATPVPELTNWMKAQIRAGLMQEV